MTDCASAYLCVRRVSSISICGYRACIAYVFRCIFHSLLIIHLCLFECAAIKVSAKSSEFCLNFLFYSFFFFFWCGSASHLQGLQRLMRGASYSWHIHIMCPSQFTGWQSCNEMHAGINRIALLNFSRQDV